MLYWHALFLEQFLRLLRGSGAASLSEWVCAEELVFRERVHKVFRSANTFTGHPIPCLKRSRARR